MNYRVYTETAIIATGVTWSTSKQTFRLPIKQSKRRLEGIIAEVIFLTPAGAPTATSDGFANVFSEVRLVGNDVLGKRNIIQAPSSVLLNFFENSGNLQSRWNMISERPTVAAKNYRVQIPILVRHPAIEEPVGNILGIPMDQLNEDLSLELDLDSNASCASANPSVSIPVIRCTLFYRDVDPAVKYLPTELITNRVVYTASGKNTYDVPQSGFLSALQVDQYSTFPTVRALLATATDHELQIALGSNKIVGIYPSIMDGAADLVNEANTPATPFFGRVAGVDTSGTDAFLTGRALGSYFFDFLFDWSKGGAMTPASVLNCNAVPLGGDRVQFTGTNFSAAGTILFTHHKFLTRNADDLKVLIGA